MHVERSDRMIYLRVLGPLVLATGTLVIVSVGGFQALSAARAYVGGESLWSKARSQTVARLRIQAIAPSAACPPLDPLLAVPLGDRAARLALDRSPPDLALARDGFLRGGNAPDDIDGMIRLYLHFGGLSLLREPIAAWRRGDELIAQLRALGERICNTAAVDAAAGTAPLRELDRLDAELVAVEKRFSASLGHASRQVERLLTGATLLLAVLLAAGSAWFVMRSLRSEFTQRRALVEANTRWDLAAEAAGVGLFVWHLADDRVELDRRARMLYGLGPDAPVTRAQLRALMHPDDRADFQQVAQRTVDHDEALRARYRILAADGSVRHVEAIGTLRQDGPKPARRQMFGVLRDVTDEVAAARLQTEKDAAERSAKARSEFLSRLSHELRTPLNAVLGMAQLLEIEAAQPLTAQQRQRVQSILDSGWHLLHLVDDVLDITRIDSGRLLLRPVPTDLRAVLRASLALIEPERRRAAVQVVDGWPAQPSQVIADPQRLQQVFVNLLSNGCKYNSRGGRLALGYRDEVDRVRLTVEDEGPGLGAEQIAELFQPFRRLGQTAEVPGTGLGLVVVKLLVEQMQGRIEVKSEPGRGACFMVILRKA